MGGIDGSDVYIMASLCILPVGPLELSSNISVVRSSVQTQSRHRHWSACPTGLSLLPAIPTFRRVHRSRPWIEHPAPCARAAAAASPPCDDRPPARSVRHVTCLSSAFTFHLSHLPPSHFTCHISSRQPRPQTGWPLNATLTLPPRCLTELLTDILLQVKLPALRLLLPAIWPFEHTGHFTRSGVGQICIRLASHVSFSYQTYEI